MRIFNKAGELREKLIKGRKNAFSRGWDTGFKVLDEIASFKPKYQTLIFSAPSIGKSTITLDLLMAQAEMGRNVCIYSPEYSDEGELLMALIQARLSKSLYGKYADKITDEEFVKALEFVDKHFVVINKPRTKKDGNTMKMSVTNVFREVYKASKHYNMKIDIVFIDPMNYFQKDGDEKFMQIQDYVLSVYEKVTEFSNVMDLHTIMSAHTRDVELKEDKELGIRYYGILHPSEIVGGQSNYRAAMQVLHLQRAPEGVLDRDGIPYPANYTIIHNQKVKPYGTGKIGSTEKRVNKDGLYFDPDTHTMYEIIDGVKYYRNEYYNKDKEIQFKQNDSESAIKPNLEFGLNDAPF